MLNSRWLQILLNFGFEFWLPLPLLALGCWVLSGFVTDRVLMRSLYTEKYLPIETQISNQPAKIVLAVRGALRFGSIAVEINKNQGFSRVKVKTINSALEELEFKFFLTEHSQIEAAISQELGLSREKVRKVVQYSQTPNSQS